MGECLKCGGFIKDYPSTRGKKKYCSVECRKSTTHIKANCLYCGDIYEVARSRYDGGYTLHKCCSRLCYIAHKKEARRKRESKKNYVCTNCLGVFIGYRRGKTGRVFCSQKCSVEYMRGDKAHTYVDGTTIGVNGYRSIKVGDKYVLEHRLVMEEHLNRKLLPGEVVHHIDGDRLNNNIENLEVMEKKEHDRKHTTERHAQRRSESSRSV